MELNRIRTGLTGNHMASGDTVYNLFVSDRQVEDAIRLLGDIFSDKASKQEVLTCPQCGSTDVHPVLDEDEGDDYFPLEPRFRQLQKSDDPIDVACQKCGHQWS